MSVRLYVGNLPQSFDAKEIEALFASVGEGIRFKAVQDRETGAGRGFGFANIDDEKLADAVIEHTRALPGGCGSLVRAERHQQHRHRARAGDGFGVAAQHHAAQTATAVGAQHDQVA